MWRCCAGTGNRPDVTRAARLLACAPKRSAKLDGRLADGW